MGYETRKRTLQLIRTDELEVSDSGLADAQREDGDVQAGRARRTRMRTTRKLVWGLAYPWMLLEVFSV